MPTRKNAHKEKCPRGKIPTRKNAHEEKCPRGEMPTRENTHKEKCPRLNNARSEILPTGIVV